MKDKIFEHATKMLTSEVRGILKSKSAVSPIPTSSPSPESEFPKVLKTILKKENSLHNSSSSEDEGVSSEDSTEDSSESEEKNKKIRDKGSSSEKENTNANSVLERVNNKRNKEGSDNDSFYSDVNLRDFEVKSKVRKHLEEVQQMSSSTEETPQTSDGESSGGREVKRIIGNEAVARRRQAAINRQKEK